MEEKLREIVLKIEQSKLSNDDKEALYAAISESLHRVVVPVLLKYIPTQQLKDLADNPGKTTVESLIELIKTAMQDGQALKEIVLLTDEVLADAEVALQKGGIV